MYGDSMQGRSPSLDPNCVLPHPLQFVNHQLTSYPATSSVWSDADFIINYKKRSEWLGSWHWRRKQALLQNVLQA